MGKPIWEVDTNPRCWSSRSSSTSEQWVCLTKSNQADERLLTLDPASVAHVLKNSTMYEKPWQSRALIGSLIGCGMLGAEGQVHKRQRRVATPAFSIQNLRNLVPLVFKKGTQLKDKWTELILLAGNDKEEEGLVLDVCHWVSRATFDVIGVAGEWDEGLNMRQLLTPSKALTTTLTRSKTRPMNCSMHTKICSRLASRKVDGLPSL
jgi:cytochrome P450